MSDTSREVSKRVERWRGMSTTQKLELVDELNRACAALATAGARQRHPHATEREIRHRVLALSLHRDLMVAAYDWDPQIERY